MLIRLRSKSPAPHQRPDLLAGELIRMIFTLPAFHLFALMSHLSNNRLSIRAAKQSFLPTPSYKDSKVMNLSSSVELRAAASRSDGLCLVEQRKRQKDSPCVSMSMRNVPSSLNWTGGISEGKNFNTTSATPADSILDLFTTERRNALDHTRSLEFPNNTNEGVS